LEKKNVQDKMRIVNELLIQGVFETIFWMNNEEMDGILKVLNDRSKVWRKVVNELLIQCVFINFKESDKNLFCFWRINHEEIEGVLKILKKLKKGRKEFWRNERITNQVQRKKCLDFDEYFATPRGRKS
jgi:hypothetical protein